MLNKGGQMGRGIGNCGLHYKPSPYECLHEQTYFLNLQLSVYNVRVSSDSGLVMM